ncbi:hypothetical protein [Parvularcula maris]|uniref:Uncharacterized protein n=1 Tax=Parvularcula maris TaxID=2965077 RepID=A0A9X2L786_9PROT|nr:hypothetical protein [Parvularcula maris]MCQ8184273.1 hypothetical protein [Parvularcula maris]
MDHTPTSVPVTLPPSPMPGMLHPLPKRTRSSFRSGSGFSTGPLRGAKH